MSHHSPRRRPATFFTSLIALTATLVAASLGLAACGGSSSTTTTTTTTETTANAAATATTAATGTGTSTAGTDTSGGTSTGTSSTGTSSTGTTPGASTTSATPAARSARFAAVRTCLSKKGITLPQRETGGFAGGAQLPTGMSRAQFAEALKSCGAGFKGSQLSKGTNRFRNPFNNSRFHAVLLRFAACLRQHGIDIGEPNTTGKGPVFATKGLNTGSPQFKAASVKCRGTLLGGLKANRAHPGTSAG